MTRYGVAPDAQSDLDSIYDYVARESLSAADAMLDALQQRFRLLASQPFLGQLRAELAPDLRSFSVGNYVIFYRPVRVGIEVTRVLHSARDIDKLF
ncbi:MAG: type II toxin-antitoxin system RelE/ParE family toxin [Planctomycetia bacterium]|nr:type II toxin-antitoxin system RelE/ParE family toxin [Planctomycetia bacterium]